MTTLIKLKIFLKNRRAAVDVPTPFAFRKTSGHYKSRVCSGCFFFIYKLANL